MKAAIHHIGVVVEDLHATRTFLERVLGFELVETRSFPESLIDTAYLFLGEGTQIELVALGDPVARAERLGSEGPARIEHIALEVDDVEAVRVALRERGVEMQTDEPVLSGNTRAFFTRANTSQGIVFQFLDRNSRT